MNEPAVSHALARLRYVLKDELFVRTPEGMRQPPALSGWPAQSTQHYANSR